MKNNLLLFVLFMIAGAFIHQQANGQANTELSNLTATSVNQSLLPNTSASLDLGSSTTSWKDIFIDGKIKFDGSTFLSNEGTRNCFAGMVTDPPLGSLAADNSFFGYFSGASNHDGNQNSFFGSFAGYSTVDGSDNSFFGASAGMSTTSGSNNCFFGMNAGASNTTAGNSSFFGMNAGASNTIAGNNSFFGAFSGQNNIAGVSNSYFGVNTGSLNVSGYNNSFFGADAGHACTAVNNSFFGSRAGDETTTGQNNSFFGVDAGGKNIDGGGNCFFGGDAGYSNTSGGANIFTGYYSGFTNTTGSNNCYYGYLTGYGNLTGSSCTFIGTRAGYASTANNNTFVGSMSGYFNTTGTSNTFYGNSGGYTTTTGSSNTFIGFNAGSGNTTGSQNSCLGYSAGVSSSGLGNATALGYGAAVNASNKVRLGSANVTVVEGQVAYSFPSDGRFKTNIKEDVPGIEFINRLRPVTYNFETQKFDEFLHRNDSTFKEREMETDYSASSQIKQSGFIAQEVEKVMQETGYDFNGVHHPESDIDNYSMSYELLTVPLVKAVQELSSEDQRHKTKDVRQDQEIELLKSENEKLKTDIENLKELISSNQAIKNGATAPKTLKTEIEIATLGQNIPNPFGNSSVIPFHIPEGCTSASLVISESATGRMMIEIPVSCNEAYKVIEGERLAAGEYTYSLVVNGEVIDTRQMLIER
ncbi:MAG TPA: tail fiber domain-containing protein [Chitinophagales bacterium]|nr:tail fiber domain-containing protein [Chitinophagales bacterium]